MFDDKGTVSWIKVLLKKNQANMGWGGSWGGGVMIKPPVLFMLNFMKFIRNEMYSEMYRCDGDLSPCLIFGLLTCDDLAHHE